MANKDPVYGDPLPENPFERQAELDRRIEAQILRIIRRRKIIWRSVIGCLFGLVVFGGWTLYQSGEAPASIAEAQNLIAQSQYPHAAIELKRILQATPDDRQARWLLGVVHLAMEAGSFAEKEFNRARELGFPDRAVIPKLAQAFTLQGKHTATLALQDPADASSLELGELASARGLAYLTKGDKEKAGALTLWGLELAPESVFSAIARARYLISGQSVEEAGQVLRALLARLPNSGLALSILGDIYAHTGENEKAEESYTKAAAARPWDRIDLYKRGFIRLVRKNHEGALADGIRLNTLLPTFQPGWYLTGLIHYQKQRFKQANEALMQSYKLKKEHLQTLMLIAWTQHILDQPEQAIVFARQANSLAPNSVQTVELLATVLLRAGKGREAQDVIVPLARAQPGNLGALLLLGNALLAQNNTHDAVKVLEQIATIAPGAAAAQTRAGVAMLRAGAPDKALATLEQSAKVAPQATDTRAAFVAALLTKNAYDEALAAAELFRQQNPGNPAALQLLAVTHLARGEIDAAKPLLHQVLELRPGDSQAARMLARALEAEKPRKAGKNSDAQSTLRTDDTTAAIRRARQLLAANDPQGALKALSQKKDLEDARALDLKAQAYARLRQFERALNALQQLARQEPDTASTHFRLAGVYMMLQEPDRAAASLEEAARLTPNDVTIGLARAQLLASRGELDAALALLHRLEPGETDPAALKVRRLIAEKRGDHPEIVRLSELLLESQPSSSAALRLARAHTTAGQPEQAEATLVNWLKERPGDEIVSLALAKMYGDSQRPRQAVALLRPLADQHPDHIILLNNLAGYLNQSGTEPLEALRVAERAYRAAPGSAAIIDTYAATLAGNGQFEKALLVLDEGIRRDPQAAMLRLQLANVLWLAGNRAQAKLEFEKVKTAGIPPAGSNLAAELARNILGAD